ncbi:MAG: PilN domain-containing protein [Methylophilaceae bacterium]|nr:PilN domain-containing protein [Methylophilaceae bacterium]
MMKHSQMKPLTLDYSSYQQKTRQKITIIIITLLSLLLASLILQHRGVLHKIEQKQAQLQIGIDQPVIKNALSDENTLSREKTAADIQHVLNVPWYELLTTLEREQKTQTTILLSSLQPNPDKGEVAITGFATDFNALMAYVKTLSQQAIFSEVTLLNQRQTVEDGKQALAFTLFAQWKI